MGRLLGDTGETVEQETIEQSQGEGGAPAPADGPPAWFTAFSSTIADTISRTVEEKIKAIAPQATAPAPQTKNVSDDADAIASRRFALEESLAGLNGAAKEKLRNLYLQERPTDVATWANGYISAFGIQRENAMDKPQHANASVTSGGVPKNDRAIANYNKSLFDLTQDEIKDRIQSKGLAKTGEELLARARKELSGVTLKFENKGR